MKKEILALQRRLAEVREQKEEYAIVQARISVTVQENEQLMATLKSTELAEAEMQQKLSGSVAELDWMSFARDEALSVKQDELEGRMSNLIGVSSCISEREAQVKDLRVSFSPLQKFPPLPPPPWTGG